jgi:uncharacterized protein YciI
MHVVHIRKYGDLIPVQFRESDQEAHLEALAQTHGEAAIVLEDGRTLAEVRQPERDRAEQEAAEAAEAERVRLEAEAAEAAKRKGKSDQGGDE